MGLCRRAAQGWSEHRAGAGRRWRSFPQRCSGQIERILRDRRCASLSSHACPSSHQRVARTVFNSPDHPDDHSRHGSFSSLRQCCRPDAGAIFHSSEGICRAFSPGCGTCKNRQAIAHREPAPLFGRRRSGNSACLLERTVACSFHVSRRIVAVPCGGVSGPARSCVHLGSFRSHRDFLRRRAGVSRHEVGLDSGTERKHIGACGWRVPQPMAESR